MDKREFFKIREYLRKSQKEMAQLVGMAVKTIQSFEQGYRRIPVHIERQVLLLLAKKNAPKTSMPCWEIKTCPERQRENCPAWEFNAGDICWFINGTICEGEVQENWRKKMKKCRKCQVFRSMVPSLL